MQLLARALTVVLHNTTGAETIVPIPLAKKRKAERGYNQIEEVLRYVRTDSVLHIETRALKRIRNTRPQTKLTRKERAQNVADAFLVTKPERIRNKNIILIDDVVTTGATLQAAKAALMPHKPASVACIALARAE
jgi:ComF family protein